MLPQSYHHDATLLSDETTVVSMSNTIVSQLQQHLKEDSDLPMGIWDTFFDLTSQGTSHQSALVKAVVLGRMAQRLNERSTQTFGCEALHELAKDHSTNQWEVYRSGGIATILRSMKRHPAILGWCDDHICNIICELARNEKVNRGEVVTALLAETNAPSADGQPSAYDQLIFKVTTTLASTCPKYRYQCEALGIS